MNVWVLIGALIAANLALTTDQIMNNVYDAVNSALKVKVVAGTAGATPAGNVNDIQIKASATTLGAYAGTSCPGQFVRSLDSAGAATCAAAGAGTVTGSGTTGLIPDWTSSTALGDSLAYRISVTNDTVTGTTTAKLAKFTSAGRAIITSAAETSGILGVIHSGAGTTGNAIVVTLGATSCVSDNATTAGHYATVSASTAGSCSDTGSTTFPAAGTQVIGIWTETGAAGTRTMFFNTPDVASAASGGGGGGAKNPAGAAGNVQYRATGNNFAAEAAFTYDATNNRHTWTGLTSDPDSSLGAGINMLYASGTMPSTPTTTVVGALFDITGAGSASQVSYAFDVVYRSGYTGNAQNAAVTATNQNGGSGANLALGSAVTDVTANLGGRFVAGQAATGSMFIGGIGYVNTGHGTKVGLYGRVDGTGTGPNVGVLGHAVGSTEGTNLKNIPGYFVLGSTAPTSIASNVDVTLVSVSDATADIFRGYSTTTKKFTVEADGDIVTLGGLSYSAALFVKGIVSMSGDLSATATDRYIRCTAASGGNRTYTLPAATGSGRVLELKKIDSGTSACVVDGSGAETIDGATTVTISAQYDKVSVIDVASGVWDVL